MGTYRSFNKQSVVNACRKFTVHNRDFSVDTRRQLLAAVGCKQVAWRHQRSAGCSRSLAWVGRRCPGRRLAGRAVAVAGPGRTSSAVEACHPAVPRTVAGDSRSPSIDQTTGLRTLLLCTLLSLRTSSQCTPASLRTWLRCTLQSSTTSLKTDNAFCQTSTRNLTAMKNYNEPSDA